MTTIIDGVLTQLLRQIKTNFDNGVYEHAYVQESAICDLLDVSYDFEHHDAIFIAYYLGEITAEQLVGGIVQ